MGLLTWLRDRTVSDPEPTIATRAIPAVWPVPTHEEYIQGAYLPGAASGDSRWALALPAVFRCVHLLQSLARQLPLDEQRQTGQRSLAGRPRWEVVAPSALVRRPDPTKTRGDFVAGYVAAMALRGGAPIRLYRDGANRVARMKLIHPPLFRVEWADETQQRRVYFHGSEQLELFRDLLYVRYLEIDTELYGLGPIQAARSGLAGQLAQATWIASVWGDPSVPAGNLVVPWELDSTEAAAVLTDWEVTHQGKSRTGVLSGGVTWQDTQLRPVDAQYVETHIRSIQDVALLFGVDPFLLAAALTGSSLTYQNQQDVHQGIYRSTLQPAYLAPLEEHFAEVLPPASRARFNFEDLTRPEEAQRMETYSTAISSGVLTVDEARDREGLEPREDEPTPQLAPVEDLDERARRNAI